MVVTAGYTYHGPDNSKSKSLYHMCTSQSNVAAGYICEPKRILDVCQPFFEESGYYNSNRDEGCGYPTTRGPWSDLTAYEKHVASRLRNEEGQFYTQGLWDAEDSAEPDRPNSKSWNTLSAEDHCLNILDQKCLGDISTPI